MASDKMIRKMLFVAAFILTLVLDLGHEQLSLLQSTLSSCIMRFTIFPADFLS